MRALARGGVDAAAITAVRQQVLGHWSLVATGAWIDGGFIVAEILDRMRASEALLSEFVAQRWTKEWSPAKLAAAAPKRDYPVEALVYHAARAQLVERMTSGAAGGVRAFAAEPQLVAFRLTMGRRSDAQGWSRAEFDVLANRLRLVYGTQENPPSALLARLGTLDTQIEYLLLGGGNALNAHSVLRAAKKNNVPLIVLHAGGESDLARLALTPATRELIEADLRSGFVVVAPAGWVVRDRRVSTLG